MLTQINANNSYLFDKKMREQKAYLMCNWALSLLGGPTHTPLISPMLQEQRRGSWRPYVGMGAPCLAWRPSDTLGALQNTVDPPPLSNPSCFPPLPHLSLALDRATSHVQEHAAANHHGHWRQFAVCWCRGGPPSSSTVA